MAVGVVPATGPARPRRWPWVMGVLGVALALTVGALVAIVALSSDGGDDADAPSGPSNADLPTATEPVRADFTTGPAPLSDVVEEDSGYSYEAVDGVYRIRSIDEDPDDAWAPAPLDGITNDLTVTATVAAIGPGSGVEAGVGCATDWAGYDLWVRPTSVLLFRWDESDFDGMDRTELDQPFQTPSTVRIRCAANADGTTDVSGYVNGERVVRATDQNGIGGFSLGGLNFSGSDATASVDFDDLELVPRGS